MPCSEPASGAQLVFAQGGRVAARVVVGEGGSYTVSLAAGTYVVTVSAQRPTVGRIDPATVHVIAGRSRAVDFRIDTGLR